MTIMSKVKGVRMKMEYTFENLLEDILDIPEENESMREVKAKKIIMLMLFNLAIKYRANINNDGDKLRKALERAVLEDELLSGYAFFVSQNPQFDYTWSYMRKREKGYIDFLAKAVFFLKNVLIDINILARNAQELEDVHFVFGDIFDVSLIVDTPYVKTGLRWENFYRIVATKENYNIAAIKGEGVLVVRDRKSDSDVVGIIDAVLQLLHNKEIDS